MNFPLCWAQATAETDHTLSENTRYNNELRVSTVVAMQRVCRAAASAYLKIGGFIEH